jgi:hypothetical protein
MIFCPLTVPKPIFQSAAAERGMPLRDQMMKTTPAKMAQK